MPTATVGHRHMHICPYPILVNCGADTLYLEYISLCFSLQCKSLLAPKSIFQHNQPMRCRNAQHLAAHLVYPPCQIGLGVQCVHPLPRWAMLWRPTSKNMAAHHNQAAKASDDALISPKWCKKGCKKKPYHLQSPWNPGLFDFAGPVMPCSIHFHSQDPLCTQSSFTSPAVSVSTFHCSIIACWSTSFWSSHHHINHHFLTVAHSTPCLIPDTSIPSPCLHILSATTT
jgi:hypothetical protein